jgi:NADH-quinone oxidoreductase subunit N
MIDNIIYLMPIITILSGAILMMLLSMYNKYKTKHFIIISSIFITIALIFSILHFGELYRIKPFNDIFNNIIVFDTFANFFNIILLFGGLLVILIGEHYCKKYSYFKGEFYSILLFAIFGMMLLAHVNELISAYIALEIASFCVYILIGFDTSRSKRVEAIFKYLVLGSFIGAFFLLGIVLVYGATGTTNIDTITEIINQSNNYNTPLFYIGISLLVFTFLFKIAAFPFHSWVLDVYRGAPILVTAFMASVFKVAIFSFFLRAILSDFISLNTFWEDALIVLTILTLTFGSFLAITQNNVKRMLAGSSIVHTGYMMLGIIALGESIESAYSIMFYLIAYLLSSIGAFGLISHIIADTRKRSTYDDFKGLGQEKPYLAALMTIFMFSLAGIPSTIGFIAKFYVFTEAIISGYIFLAIFAIIATAISLYYYFKLVAVMYFYPSFASKKASKSKLGVSNFMISVVALLIIWGGIGSAIVFFIPIPSIDGILSVVELSIQSLFIK